MEHSSPNASPLPEADEEFAKIAKVLDDPNPSTNEELVQGKSDRMGIVSTSTPKLDKEKGKARATSEGFDEEEATRHALALC